MEEVKPHGDLMLEETILPLCNLLQNSTSHEVIGRQRVSDTVGGYNIFLVN